MISYPRRGSQKLQWHQLKIRFHRLRGVSSEIIKNLISLFPVSAGCKGDIGKVRIGIIEWMSAKGRLKFHGWSKPSKKWVVEAVALHPRYHLLGTHIIYPFSQSYFFEDDSFPNFPNLVGISFKQPTTPGRLEKVDGLRSSQLLHRSFSPSRAGPFCNGSWRKVGFGSLFFFENLLLSILEQFAIFGCLGFSFPGKLPTFFFNKQLFTWDSEMQPTNFSGTSKLSKLWWDSWIPIFFRMLFENMILHKKWVPKRFLSFFRWSKG